MTMTITKRAEAGKVWMEKYLAPLVGGTITAVEGFVEDECDIWPRIHVTLASGEEVVIEVSQDEEGNGPGFPFGLPLPQNQNKE